MNLNELSFDAMLYGGLIVFFFLTLVLVCGFILGNIFGGKRCRYAFLISHTIFIGAFGLLLKNSGGDALSGILWAIPLVLDFTLWPLSIVFGGFSSWGFGFISLGLFVVGGAQWYFVGQLIDYLWSKFINNFNLRKGLGRGDGGSGLAKPS